LIRAAHAHASRGEFDAAEACIRQVVALSLSDPGTAWAVSQYVQEMGLSEEAVILSPRPPPSRVSALFDGYAPRFDGHLRGLRYRAPELIAATLARLLGERAHRRSLDVADLGCGTGLLGPLVRSHTARLVGVDLSAGMLAEARKTRAYHELVQAELTAYLAEHPAAFDVAVSADVLCYIGDLAPVFAGLALAIRRGGVAVVSVEHTLGVDYALTSEARYVHSAPYLDRAAGAAGLEPLGCERVVLRHNRGQPVDGLVWSGRLPP
jgi:predicted TPR repeat methyltransferase